jgi:ribosomal protein S18 acetylase RimI-like enzyme
MVPERLDANGALTQTIVVMSKQPTIDISLLRLNDARELAPLIAAYGQSLKRGAPRRPDEFFAETLLQDRVAELLGARIDGVLVGFLVFYDLPDPLTGMRVGQVDHLYVHHERRRNGIAKALLDLLAEEGESRGWSALVLNAPRDPAEGRKLYEKIAVTADWASFVMRFDR